MTVLVYGVCRSDNTRHATRGVADATLRAIEGSSLLALVSDAPAEILPRHRDVGAHMDVLDAAMRQGAVLPFRFGSTAESDEDVRAMLRDRAEEFAARLDELDGLVQLTLRVTHDEDALIRAA